MLLPWIPPGRSPNTPFRRQSARGRRLLPMGRAPAPGCASPCKAENSGGDGLTRFGVIFDMDGVLVDSYFAHYASWCRLAASQGRRISLAQFDATFGRTSREVIAALWPDVANDAQQLAEWDRRKEALFREILAQDFPAMPGAVRLVRQLWEAGVPVALGSSGPPENVALVLERLGIRPRLAALVTGAEVRRGKPDPEVFLLAALRLGIPPQRCVVIEDAPAGIEAAHRAGMSAIGVLSTGRRLYQLAKANRLVRSLEQLSPCSLAALVARPWNHQPNSR